MASLVAQKVKNLPAIQETQIQSLGQEDPLEEKMATHSSILAWRTPRTEDPGGLESGGKIESDATKHTHIVPSRKTCVREETRSPFSFCLLTFALCL